MAEQTFRIWLSPPHMGGKEIDFVRKAFEENWVAPLGPHIDGFEEDLAAYLGENKKLVALNTGTAAVHLALILAGVGKGDTVICQSFTFSASVNPVVYLGAEPVFVDSEAGTWNISPALLEEAIQDCIHKGKTPKAVVVVDLYGMPARYEEILKITSAYNIPLIEDAAEALGSSYQGKKCGTFGDFGIVSFNGNKIITTSGGGALVCASGEEARQAKFLSTQARDQAPHYEHSHIGYNYRMSNISAGIGRGQMLVLDDHIRAKRSIHDFYQKAFAGAPGIKMHEEPGDIFRSNYWLSCILVDPHLTGGADRETIRLKLLDAGIESRPLWKPMHLQPIFKNCLFYTNGTSEILFNQGLCLPSGAGLTKDELSEICDIVWDML